MASDASAMANALTLCKTAFGNCRKAEDQVAGILHACNSDTDAMKSKLLALKSNKASIQRAQAVLDKLIGRLHIGKPPLPQRVSSKAITTCSGVLAVATAMIALVMQNPSSAKVGVLAEEIAASTELTCTVAEKAEISEVRVSISVAVLEVDTEINTVQISLSSKFYLTNFL